MYVRYTLHMGGRCEVVDAVQEDRLVSHDVHSNPLRVRFKAAHPIRHGCPEPFQEVTGKET